jgi:hypothetical protein
MSELNKESALEMIDQLKSFIESLPEGEASTDGDAGAPAGVTIPSSEEVDGLETDALNELATSLSIDIDGKEEDEVRTLVKTLAQINADEEVEDDSNVNTLATALGLTPEKKVAKTIAALKEWATALTSAGETSTEGETPAADADATPEPAAPEGDGVDRDAVAAEFKKFPDLATMEKQLTAYNAKAGEEITFKPKNLASVKEAYRSLVAQMVDTVSEVTAWGTPYIRDGAGWCCGLILEDVKVKGEKRDVGKCQVTGKQYAFNEDDSTFVEIKAAKK